MSGAAHTPELSVVIGANGRVTGVGDCLAAVMRACAGVDAEVILVDASSGAADTMVRRDFPTVTVVTAEAGTLMPSLWASGYRHSHGRTVAFTTVNCIVPDGWARAIQDGLAAGNVGVGGALRLGKGASATDWAIFQLRYSAFLGRGDAPARVSDVPGDNAAYRRDELDAFADTFTDGFWEVEFHRLLRPRGGTLELLPEMAVSFGRSGPLKTLVAQRYHHGRHCGRWRVETGAGRAWLIALAAPAVPTVLLLRTAAALKRTGSAMRFGALPAFLALASAWAIGEVVGAFDRGGGGE